ncbi:MAG: hypothetical protein WC619_00255 [Patescibacteria group bacterium]
MFDDLNQKTNKIEDIFSETEKGGKPNILKPAGSTPVPPPIPGAGIREGGEGKKEGVKKILIFAILIVAVVLIIFGIFWVLKKIDTTLNTGTGEQAQEENLTGAGVPNIPAENQAPEPAPTEPPSPAESMFFPPSIAGPIDSDQDGLTDEEEVTLGTDINNTDTDSDGLFDREEVRVYKTNPLVADTDGDGYSDGDEVKNGYNPAGPGKLYEIQ